MIVVTSKALPLEPMGGFNNVSSDKTNVFCFYILLDMTRTFKQNIGYLHNHSRKTKQETFVGKCNNTLHGLDFGSVHLGCCSKNSSAWVEFIFHGLGGWEVQDQNTSRFSVWRELLSASQMAFSGCVLACGTVNKFPVSCFIRLLLFLYYSGFFRIPTE